MADSSGSGHPTGGRQRKHKSPPASSAAPLAPPRLPEHLLDGPSGDEENEAKRPRSSTTPKSGKGRDPDGCNRLMGITSVDYSSEENGFGDGELINTENAIGGVANNSKTPVNSHSGSGIRPGVDKDSRRYGSATFVEIFNSLPNLAASSACAYQGATEFLRAQSNPQQNARFSSPPKFPFCSTNRSPCCNWFVPGNAIIRNTCLHSFQSKKHDNFLCF